VFTPFIQENLKSPGAFFKSFPPLPLPMKTAVLTPPSRSCDPVSPLPHLHLGWRLVCPPRQISLPQAFLPTPPSPPSVCILSRTSAYSLRDPLPLRGFPPLYLPYRSPVVSPERSLMCCPVALPFTAQSAVFRLGFRGLAFFFPFLLYLSCTIVWNFPRSSRDSPPRCSGRLPPCVDP